VLAAAGLCLACWSGPAAAAVDDYIKRYLADGPIELELDEQGNARTFTPSELGQGKQLFEDNCLSCHVGGSTLPQPEVSLSAQDLAGATPPRNNIDALVAFMRNPQTYDGRDANLLCRQVPPSWMPRERVEKIAAFILRASQKAPGWGTKDF